MNKYASNQTMQLQPSNLKFQNHQVIVHYRGNMNKEAVTLQSFDCDNSVLLSTTMMYADTTNSEHRFHIIKKIKGLWFIINQLPKKINKIFSVSPSINH